MQKTSRGMNLGKLFTFSIIPNATEKKKKDYFSLFVRLLEQGKWNF